MSLLSSPEVINSLFSVIFWGIGSIKQCPAFDPDALKDYINRMQADFVTRKDIEIMENGVSYPSEMLSDEFISQMQTVEKELAAKRIILDYVEGKLPEQ